MINKTDYILTNKNYIQEETIKDKIVIGNSLSNDLKYFNGWLTRLGGEYKGTSMFTIDIDGTIYQHFDTKYYSNYMTEIGVNENLISVNLVNEGWLIKDKNYENRFYNYVGNIYNKEVYTKKWRGYEFWAEYTEEQFKSTIDLVRKLCDEHVLDRTVISHNTKLDSIKDIKGVLYKSNFKKYYSDLNPSWKFDEFKIKVEK